MIERVRARKEVHRQRSRLYRIGFGIVGGLLILAGLALSLPGVPGPGLLVAAIGLGMLALEFDRAERLLERLLVRLERVTDQASNAGPAQKAAVAALAVLAVAALAGAVVLWDIPFLPG